jgi:hypothetical protein
MAKLTGYLELTVSFVQIHPKGQQYLLFWHDVIPRDSIVSP